MRRKSGASTGGHVVSQTSLPALLVLMMAVPWGAARTASAAPARRVTYAAQADLGDVARRLPIHGSLRVEGVPFEGNTTALELERFEAFAPDAKVVIEGDHGESTVPVPDNAYFRGAVEGDLGAVAVLTARANGTVRGLIVKNGEPWVISDEAGPRRAPGLATRKVDFVKEFGDHPFRCAADEAATVPPALSGLPVGAATPVVAGTLVNYTARVAVETDYEFFQRFGNVTDATNYVGDLFAYASTIYESEINTSLLVSYLRLWTTSADPWVQTSCGAMLTEFQSYWNSNNTGVSRTMAHMLSGKATGCGIAYLGVLCDSAYGYGVSGNLVGNFDIQHPGVVWDILAVSHEIGHNFNTPHTHCYNGIGGSTQPVDQCYSGESGCYSGPTSLPCAAGAGNGCGTIMSYCHLLPGYYANITLTFGTGFAYGVLPGRVPTRMHDYVVSTAASYPACLQFVAPGPTLTPTTSATPTATLPATLTPTASFTRTATFTPTQTPTLTSTATRTPTRTATLVPTLSPTRTPTNTASVPPTGTPTATRTPTLSPTMSPNPTNSLTPTATVAPACPQTNLGNTLPISYSGTTTGAQNLMSGASCGGGGSNAPDASFLFTAPATGTYQIDTLGSLFDTVLYVRAGACAGPQLACNDDANGTVQSLVSLALNAGQSVVIVVDGYGTRSGGFTLNVRLTGAATPTNTAPIPTLTRTATAISSVTATPTLAPTSSPTPPATDTATPAPTLTPISTNTAPPPATRSPTSSPSQAPGGTATPVASLQLVAVQDAWIDEANPAHNRGNDASLAVYPVSKKRLRSLVKFDLSPVPAGACVSSASLVLTLTGVQSPAQTFGVHRLTQTWTEGNGVDSSGVTWSTRDGVKSWTTAGGDFAATATAAVSTGITIGVALQWDVTADVAAFRTGAALNYGWLVKDENEGTGKQFRFASRESSAITSRPQLQITFAPCP